MTVSLLLNFLFFFLNVLIFLSSAAWETKSYSLILEIGYE